MTNIKMAAARQGYQGARPKQQVGGEVRNEIIQ